MEINDKTLQILMFCALCAIAAMAFATALAVMRQVFTKESGGNGPYCGHCGKDTAATPVRGIVLVDQVYCVYACSRCQRETLLISTGE